MSNRMISMIQKVYDYLDKHGPLRVENVYEAAQKIGLHSADLTIVLGHVRSPDWIEKHGWTVPFVAKGIGLKTYSVEHTMGSTALLRNGNQLKSNEVETHLRRSLAGLDLEAKLATGLAKQKAHILSTTTRAAISLIDGLRP